MIKKSLVVGLLMVILVLGFVANVSAEKFVAKIRGGRMVLRLDPGESVRKPITLINDNNVDVSVELSAQGDLMDNIKLEEESVKVSANSEKKAYFSVKAPDESGLTESRINVKFVPEEGSPVGLSAVVIVITSDEETDEEDSDDGLIVEEESDAGITGFASVENLAGADNKSKSLLVISVALTFVLVALVAYALKFKQKKRSGGPRV